MNFFNTLQEQTAGERQQLLNNPLLLKALGGEIDRDLYVAFLSQAYHHVKHTTPLLMAAGSRIPGDREWLRNALAEYVEEELGHQEWVLNDIRACGYDAERVRNSRPNPETELMVAYAYHVIDRVNPLGFFGMVHVLEGTSVAMADEAARCIGRSAGLGKEAFTYLSSHGALDIEHVQFFENLMNRITDPVDHEQIIHCARMFYRLYADVYNSVDPRDARSLAA
ncbi:iron-containing redox enzyme family protein [Seongchinamella sediminis]|uniref:Iron-containing redox enzyme family protein n=1 Tax=Seongchinamella sediminis TaxID=2283635 RepID=A0A3L7E2A7_9GAMM|nr:iron-containing redox enzyme family protein [Seongchinamella sediminis]RLQ22473.1 iron-containing redox enzyme family protein [Seongchinamella sediminis]